MKTITAPRTAIDFLNAEKKTISIAVDDHINDSQLFGYNCTVNGSEKFKTIESMDWDEFYFEAEIQVYFDFEAYHQSASNDYPEESEISFDNIDAKVIVTECMRWNDEEEEMQDYTLTGAEYAAVVEYFENNIELY